MVTEEDLNFTEGELALYLSQQGLPASAQSLRDIISDTNGWAFSVNLVARSLRKSPGYEGYVQVAMKRNIFGLMETEVFCVISERLRRLLVRLSLIDHLSGDIAASLAALTDPSGNGEELLAELGRQNAYIRFDSVINAYLIHHLFLEFLRGKQHMLTREETLETYRTAARWCADNGFEADALGFYERVEDYEAIIRVLSTLPVQMPLDIALLAAEIFERACGDLADKIHFFAVMHVRIVVRLGRWERRLRL